MPELTLTLSHPAYPPLLKQIPQPPKQLYWQGNVEALSKPAVSIVGSRAMTEYGRHMTHRFARGLAHAGVVVVSGLAYGVDGEAHKAALAEGGCCVAILGSGLNAIYPARHLGLAQEIVKRGGLLLSEYPPSTKAAPYHFPQRNRIIAGISRATVVIEAAEGSGSLITAACALDYNRDVGVVPGDLTRPTALGTHKLLRQGAHPVASPEEVLELLHWPQVSLPARVGPPPLTGSLATLYDCLSRGINSIEALRGHLHWPISQIQSVVTILELDGYITHNAGTWHIT